MIARARYWYSGAIVATGAAILAITITTGHQTQAIVAAVATPVIAAAVTWGRGRWAAALFDDDDERARGVAVDAALVAAGVMACGVVLGALTEVGRGVLGPFRVVALVSGAVFAAAYGLLYRRR